VVERFCQCGRIEQIICGKCGGIVRLAPEISGVRKYHDLDSSIESWLENLASEDRLNSTLASYCAIDRQFKHGAPVGAAVTQAISDIGARLGFMQKDVEDELKRDFQDMISRNEVSVEQLSKTTKEVVKEQTESVIAQVRILLEQGKAISEASSLLKEAAGSVQAVLASSRIASVKGEEAEVQTIQNLRDAFFGIEGVTIEPIGGADATDGILTFLYRGLEVGRILLEIKARRAWNSEFLGQVRDDMKKYDTSLAVLVAEKLPRNAKGKGFSVDTETGIVVVLGHELVFQTVSMFYELHTTVFKLQKKALDFKSITSSRDLLFYVNDNLKCLNDCKEISDSVDQSSKKIKEHVDSISSRLQRNNIAVAKLLAPGLEA
jgi:hypothetical protein